MTAIALQFLLPIYGAELQDPSLATLLRLLLLAPILEEWITRAGLQEWLIRRNFLAGKPSVALTTIAPALGFSLLHFASGWIMVVAVFFPAFALSLVYLKHRDWRLCALVHCSLNAFALTICSFIPVLH